MNQIHQYHMINWNKPAPVLPYKDHYLTSYEAGKLNYAMALNGQTTRYVRVDNV